MRIIVKEKPHVVDTAFVSRLEAYFNTTDSASFDEVRANVQGFDILEDGEIHQHATDAGLTVL